MNFAITALAIAYLIISGFGLVKLVLKDNIPFSLFGLIPLSFGAGLGLLVVLSDLIMLLGLRLSFATLYIPLLIFFVYALKHIKIERPLSKAQLVDAIKNITPKEWLFIVVILFGIISTITLCLVFPLNFWDSRAIWATKAKMLFFSKTIFSSDFTDIARVHAHTRYPLLFPVSQTFIYFALRMADDWAIMLLICLFFPFMISFLFDLTRIYLKDREKALAAGALLASLPVFFISDGPAHSGYADTPLTMLYFLSFGITLMWKKNKETGYLIMSAFLSSILLLTKNEGIVLLLLNLLLIVMPDKLNIRFKPHDIAEVFKKGLLYLAVSLFVITPWLVLVRYIANDNDVNSLMSLNIHNLTNSYTRIPMVFGFTAWIFSGTCKNLLGDYFSWAGLWLVFIVTSVISFISRSSRGILLTLIVLANICIVTIMYSLIPIPSAADFITYMTSNIFRIYLPICPVIVLQIVTALKALEK
jgi:hypothetical protein